MKCKIRLYNYKTKELYFEFFDTDYEMAKYRRQIKKVGYILEAGDVIYENGGENICMKKTLAL